ncbi:MAG: tetratricopeptide repeat protein [Kiritimatiellia bacterium]
MKNLRFLTLGFAVFALIVSAQPQSILLQIPYIPERESVAQGLLNVQEALKELSALPEFGFPQRLPAEFLVTESSRQAYQTSAEANQFLMEGKPEKAVGLFREALVKWPEEWGLRVALADSLYAVGEHGQALENYQAVLQIAPFHFQCLNNLAWLLATTPNAELKDLETAEDLAEMAKVVQPRSHHLWSTFSQIYYETGRYAEAQIAINNSITLAQQNQVSAQVLVSYLIQRDRTVLAIEATSLLE